MVYTGSRTLLVPLDGSFLNLRNIKYIYTIYFTWMPQRQQETLYPYTRGLEFGSVGLQVRNRGINPGRKLTKDPPVATQPESGFEPATSRSLWHVDKCHQL